MQPIFAIILAMGVITAHADKKNLVVAMALSEPYVMKELLDAHDEGYQYHYEGFSVDLLKALSKEMKIKYEIKIVHSSGEYQESHQNWTGLIGELTQGSADLALGDLTVTEERAKVIEFSIPFMSGGITILAKRQVYQELYYSFLDPFTTGTWIMIAVAYLILGIVFVVLKIMRKKREKISVFSLPILKITLTIFTIFLACIYSANLSHFLSFEPAGRQIESVDDLVFQNTVKFGAVKGGSTMKFFKNKDEEVYRRIWSVMNTNSDFNVKSNKEGIEKVRDGNGKYAFLMESTSAKFVTERKCDVETVGGLINEFQYAIGLPLNSEYRKPLNQAILRLQESGVIKRLEKIWWERMRGGGGCIDRVAGCYASISLSDMSGVFWMLLTGAIVMVLVIGLEAFALKDK